MDLVPERKRKVVTAWIKPVLYPPAPERPARKPEDEKYFFRFKISKILTLEDPGEDGRFPMQHLLCRCSMLFYGYGRLQKLSNELGVRVPDICKFGTSVYKDSRAYMMDKLSSVHAAHLFPVTDFDFKSIDEKLRAVYCAETPDQIAKRFTDIETILTNMVGQTDFVMKFYNESGSVGRALDSFLIRFIRAGYRDINTDNVKGIVDSLIECLRSSMKPPADFEIGETISAIEATDLSEWVTYYTEGLHGKYDGHYNVSHRTIYEGYRNTLEQMRKPEEGNELPHTSNS